MLLVAGVLLVFPTGVGMSQTADKTRVALLRFPYRRRDEPV